jgi:hypothetical protein
VARRDDCRQRRRPGLLLLPDVGMCGCWIRVTRASRRCRRRSSVVVQRRPAGAGTGGRNRRPRGRPVAGNPPLRPEQRLGARFVVVVVFVVVGVALAERRMPGTPGMALLVELFGVDVSSDRSPICPAVRMPSSMRKSAVVADDVKAPKVVGVPTTTTSSTTTPSAAFCPAQVRQVRRREVPVAGVVRVGKEIGPDHPRGGGRSSHRRNCSRTGICRGPCRRR